MRTARGTIISFQITECIHPQSQASMKEYWFWKDSLILPPSMHWMDWIVSTYVGRSVVVVAEVVPSGAGEAMHRPSKLPATTTLSNRFISPIRRWGNTLAVIPFISFP